MEGNGLILWSPIAALAILVCVSGVLSLWSGWQRIARKFPYREVPDSRRYTFVRMSLGSGVYPWSEVARRAREMVRGSYVTNLSLPEEESEFAFYGELGESVNQTYLSGKSAKTI